MKRSRPLVFLVPLAVTACSAPGRSTPSIEASARAGTPTIVAAEPPVAATPTVVQLGGISVDRAQGLIRVPGVVALREGWLEQAVCQQGTRDHESLITVSMPPSSIHAALLLAGLEPGRPGHWRVRDDGALELMPPTGAAVGVEVEWTDASGQAQREPLAEWIKSGGASVPLSFVFAGSVMRDRSAVPYAADQSGSVIGLVTFGDEPVASVTVVPDRADIAEPSLQAWTERMPPEGTPVTVVIRRSTPRAP